MSSPFTYLHKRSNVVDRRPTAEDLFEGEIALNTYDGKLFFKTVQNGIEDVIEIGENFDGQYASLTGVPTLLSAFTNDPGYITDYTVTLADVTQHETGITITESQISDLQNYLTSVSFGDLTSTPTTLAGYGITDAATAAQGALADSALQPGRNISTLQNNVGYLTFVSNTDVTQHQSDIRILQSQVTDFYVSNTDVTQHNSDIRIVESQITDLRPYLLSVSNTDVTQHNSDIRITESQITDLRGYALPDNAMNFTNKTGNISQWTNDVGYITTAGEINDLTANVTWDVVPDQFISQSAVVQYEGNLIIFENQIGDLQAYLTAVSNTDVTQHQSDIRINQSQIVDFNVSNTDVTQHQTDLRITESQITNLRPYLLSVSNTDVTQHQSDIRITQSQITDLGVSNTDVTQHQSDLRITESQITDLQAYLTSETTTVLTANSVNQELRFTDETGAVNTIDLSWAVDDTNLARLVSGTLDANTGIATFVRDDTSTFTVNFNPLFDDTNLTRITTGSFNVNNGDLTLTRSDATTVITNLEGRYLTSVSNTDVTQHNSDIRITESQITDLQTYLTAEADPVYISEKGQPSGTATLDSAGLLLDQTVSANNVTQHEASLSITESQITDLQAYLTTYTESSTLSDVLARGATTTTTAVIPFLYANQAAFPSASTYHGAIAHSHADGAMYFAHSGSWNKLANDSQLSAYLTSETNDLTSAVTWATVPDAYVSNTSVTQHQADLSITESQISDLQTYLTSVSNTDVTQHQTDIRITESQITDLQTYLTAEADTLATVTGRGSSTTDAITVGGLSFNAADGIQIDALESLLFNIDSDNDQTNRVFGVKTNGADTLFTIQDNGDVAIGTHAPVCRLDVREEATGGSAQIRLYNTDNTDSIAQTASLFLSPDSRGNGALIFAKKENADFSTSASRDVALVFSPVLNNAQTEAMRIKASGEVGIGVTPLAPFHVRKSLGLATELEVARFETFLTGGVNGQQLLKVLANNVPTTGEYCRFESIFIDSLGSSSDASFEFNGTLTVDYATSGSSTGYYFSTPSTTGLQCSNGGVGGTTIRLYNNNVEVLEHNQVQNIAKFATQVEVEDTTNSTSASTGALIVDGGVGIASDLYVGGTITELSSIRYKENVRNLDSSIVPLLRPVLYDEKDSDGKDIPGLIAEEVAEVCTNVVSYNEEGNPEGLQYSRLIPYLIDHIQKLEKRIEDLEKNG